MLRGKYEDADWATLTAAYFDHPDMRDLFDGLRSDDADEVGLAWEELAPTVMESGEVFESTAAAIPLLLGLVRTARHGRAETLRIVGQCADPNRAHGDRLPMVQAALAAHADLVRAFVNDDDPEVREAAEFTLNRCRDAASADPALAEGYQRHALPSFQDSVVCPIHTPRTGLACPLTRLCGTPRNVDPSSPACVSFRHGAA
jgi:hypothetical protein